MKGPTANTGVRFSVKLPRDAASQAAQTEANRGVKHEMTLEGGTDDIEMLQCPSATEKNNPWSKTALMIVFSSTSDCRNLKSSNDVHT